MVNKLRLPSIVGLLVTGIVAGPSVLRLVKAQDDVDMLAELGVILLMFAIGLEFSLSSLSRLKRAGRVSGRQLAGRSDHRSHLSAGRSV